VLRVVSDRAARGTLRLLRGSTAVATRSFTIPRGRIDLRYVLPRRLAGGWYRIKGSFVGARGEVAPVDRRFQLRR
jgi:hypothetical protein